MTQPDRIAQPDNQPGRLERFGRAFAENPLYQGLTDISGAALGIVAEGAFPGASTVAPAATTGVRVATLAILRLHQKRADRLNAAVAGATTSQPEDVLRREDFLHCYLADLRATIHTRREEKIDLFARLLVSTIEGADLAGVDEFEELLSILDELSFREIRILTILDRFTGQQEKDWTKDGRQAVAEAAREFWPDLMDAISAEVGVPNAEVGQLLNRLGRTGLYQLRGAYGINVSGGGYLTPRYYRLRQLIQDDDGNVIPPASADRQAP